MGGASNLILSLVSSAVGAPTVLTMLGPEFFAECIAPRLCRRCHISFARAVYYCLNCCLNCTSCGASYYGWHGGECGWHAQREVEGDARSCCHRIRHHHEQIHRCPQPVGHEQRWLPAVRHRQLHRQPAPVPPPVYRPNVPDEGEFPVNCIVIHSNFIPEYVIIDSGDHFTY